MVNAGRKRKDIVACHLLQHLLALSYFHYYHIDAIGYVEGEEDIHRIEPVADMEASALTITYAEG